MGNQSSAPEPEPEPDPFPIDPNYKYPENLYVETSGMCAASFLAYQFGYMREAGRRAKKEGRKLIGYDLLADTDTRAISRNFTAKEIIQIIKDNVDDFKAIDENRFGDDESALKLTYALLEQIQKRADESGLERPITLEEFEDRHQDEEAVYAVCKDDISKRITLVFRGTDNTLAFRSNWLTNVSFWGEDMPTPAEVTKVEGQPEVLSFHAGFYNFIFGKTKREDDADEKTKYDEILEDILPLLKKNQGYKLYITGHSLGAALSSVCAIKLAGSSDLGIPKPVTCLNFASPRCAGYDALIASQILEKQGNLRLLRIVNDNDTITAIPNFGYHHLGIMIKLYKDGSPLAKGYPKYGDFANWASRAWHSGHLTMTNVDYDHRNYFERVQLYKEQLEALDLNNMYGDTDLVGDLMKIDLLVSKL